MLVYQRVTTLHQVGQAHQLAAWPEDVDFCWELNINPGAVFLRGTIEVANDQDFGGTAQLTMVPYYQVNIPSHHMFCRVYPHAWKSIYFRWWNSTSGCLHIYRIYIKKKYLGELQVLIDSDPPGSSLRVASGDLWQFAVENHHAVKNGKPSISMGHGFHGYVKYVK